MAVVGFVIVMVLGILVMIVPSLRQYGVRARCQNHMRLLAEDGIRNAAAPGRAPSMDAFREIPSGTVFNADLTPDERMSWLVAVTLPLEAKGHCSGLHSQFSPLAVWDAAAHRSAIHSRVTVFLCPAAPPADDPNRPALTQYVGLTGLGQDSATLPIDHERAGAFRYNAPTPITAFRAGLSHTATIAETNEDLGAWARGGHSTLRSLDASADAQLGRGRQFGGLHLEGTWFGFADGSARLLTDSTDPLVLRRQFTLAAEGSD